MSDPTDFLLARIAEDEEMWAMARDGGMVITVNGQSAIPPQSWVETRLSECEAKRRIVEIAGMERFRMGEHDGLYWTLLHLALPYADHPDYREEWTP